MELKRTKLLHFASQHPKGLRFTDLQRFIVELNGYDYDTFDLVRVWDSKYSRLKLARRRRYRGYWCDYLCKSTGYRIVRNDDPRRNRGEYYDRGAILATFFKKDSKGRYRLNAKGRKIVDEYNTYLFYKETP
jgi:hypothetical protein